MTNSLSSKTLVERLRKFHAEIVECDEGHESGQMKMTREAADEIERLREELRSRETEHCRHGRPIGHCDTCEEDAERAAEPPSHDLLTAWDLLAEAERIVTDFANRNAKWADSDGAIQDPWGAHGWLERYRAAVTKSAVCGTCNGRGEVGGFVNAENGYQTDPCPTCTGPETAEHHELCDVNDANAEGIRKPCNCIGRIVAEKLASRGTSERRCACGQLPGQAFCLCVETLAAPWRCTVCRNMNPDDATYCRQCDYSRMVMRNGKAVPRDGKL